MAEYPSSSRSIKLRTALIAEVLALCSVCALATLDWLAHLSLSQDSTGYIVAASNLLRTGSLSQFVNFTDWVDPPSVVPYSGQPPGFPLFLAPFLAAFHDPMISAAVAQSVCLVLFYTAVYLFTRKLSFSPLLSVVTLILFAFIRPFRLIHTTYWSETLFIALSIAAAYFAVDLLAGSSRRRDWILFLMFLALSTTVRYAGLANLALIAPLMLRWDTARAAWRLLTHRYMLTGILVAGGLLVASAMLADLLPYAKPGIGPMQWRGIVLGTAGLLIGSAGLLVSKRRVPGRNRSDSQACGAASSEVDVPAWSAFALLAAVAPTAVWFTRNRLLHGVSEAEAHELFQSFHAGRLWDPFKYVWTDLLSFPDFLRVPLALLLAVLLILPLLPARVLAITHSRKSAHISIVDAASAHFVLIWFASLATEIPPIHDRFFSPVLAFLLLALLNGLQHASELVRPRAWRAALLVGPLVSLFLSSAFSPPDPSQFLGRINYPIERQLWSEIDKIDWTRSSSCFYSDAAYTAGGFIHQIFSGRPQGIIWERKVLQDPEKLKHILSICVDPFILVIEDGREAGILEEMNASGAVPLNKITFRDTGFVLYLLDD